MSGSVCFKAIALGMSLLWGCYAPKNALPARNFDSTIISNIPSNKWIYGLPDRFEMFYPLKSDLRKIEKVLKEAYQNEIQNQNFESKIPLKDYKRQYFGFKNASGARIVLVQCFALGSSVDDDYWRNNFFHMDDGCEGVFRVKINLETGEYFDFNINPCA